MSMRYKTLVARFWLRVRGVPQSPCRRQSRDKRQGLWGREWRSLVIDLKARHAQFNQKSNFQGRSFPDHWSRIVKGNEDNLLYIGILTVHIVI